MEGALDAAKALTTDLTRQVGLGAEPWIMLGEIALRQGVPDEAVRAARRALGFKPATSFVHVLLCQGLIGCSRYGDALSALEDAAATAPPSGAAQHTIGALLLRLGRVKQAQQLFTRAANLEPQTARFRYSLALTERILGDFSAAEANMNAALALDPAMAEAYFIRSELRTQTDDANHVASLLEILGRSHLPTALEIPVRYALGKELEDLGDYSAALDHFSVGAALQRATQTYELRNDLQLVSLIMASQTAVVLAKLRAEYRDVNSEDSPIFIVGLPRSGTTLIERIVASHSLVRGGGELGALPNQLQRQANLSGLGGDAWVYSFDRLNLGDLGRKYAAIAREYIGDKSMRFTDKYPPNFLLSGLISVVLPKAKIITVTRDPMDLCLALYKSLFSPGYYGYSYNLGEVAQMVAAYHRLGDHWRHTLPNSQYLEITYEEVVGDLEGQCRRLLSFLNLPWESDVLRFHESREPVATASAAQVRRPLYSTAVGRWRRYAEQLEPLRLQLTRLLPGYDPSAF